MKQERWIAPKDFEAVKTGDIKTLANVKTYDDPFYGFFTLNKSTLSNCPGWFDDYHDALNELNAICPGARPCGKWQPVSV